MFNHHNVHKVSKHNIIIKVIDDNKVSKHMLESQLFIDIQKTVCSHQHKNTH